MQLGEALFRKLSGGRPSSAQIGSWADALAFYRDKGGSAAAGAREAGVPASTFRGWLNGRMARADRAASILAGARAAQRRAWLPFNRERDFRSSTDFVVVGAYTYDQTPDMVELNRRARRDLGAARVAEEIGTTDRDRKVQLDRYLDGDWQDALIDAFLAGASPAELGARVHGAISDGAPFYRDTFSPTADPDHSWDVHRLTWGD